MVSALIADCGGRGGGEEEGDKKERECEVDLRDEHSHASMFTWVCLDLPQGREEGGAGQESGGARELHGCWLEERVGAVVCVVCGVCWCVQGG